MSKKYSRGQMAQITSRVRKSGQTEFVGGNTKCLICGGGFLGPKCTHSVEENQNILAEILQTSD